MRVFVLLFFALAGSLFTSQAIAAQQIPEPQSRVRITLGPGPEVVTGRFVRASADTIEIRVRDGPGWRSRLIPRDAIERVELSRGREGRPLKGVLIGAGVGGAAGVLFGLAVEGGSWAYVWTRGGTVATWGGAGAGVGALVGAVLGIGGGESWVPALLPGYGASGETTFRLVWRLPIRF